MDAVSRCVWAHNQGIRVVRERSREKQERAVKGHKPWMFECCAVKHESDLEDAFFHGFGLVEGRHHLRSSNPVDLDCVLELRVHRLDPLGNHRTQRMILR